MVEPHHRLLAGGNQQGLGMDQIAGYPTEAMVANNFQRDRESLWWIH